MFKFIFKKIANLLIKNFQNFPNSGNFDNWEVFNHSDYLNGSSKVKKFFRLKSFLIRYNIEKNKKNSWLVKYFSSKVAFSEFKDSTVLDLGCFTGGRAISWAEDYSFKEIHGIDINPVFIKTCNEMAKKKKIRGSFKLAYGEKLPFRDNFFDYIVSTDTFEHVQDINKTVNECYRVLKPNGKLLVMFPQYLQPFESHLNFVTNLPFLHWFFSSKILSKIYFNIIKQRGNKASWYGLNKTKLDSWEKLPSINGTSFYNLKKIMKKSSFSEISYIHRPILTDGRKSNMLIFKILSLLFYPLIHIKYCQEYFLGRICFVAKK
jgi:ubiquinone/menaquinone biosynthesis C-methylase UbiE